ncbi:hypothetical protein ASPACDRAFT_28643 [Aspergillus aculeatus ATCC 16872]|uniref:Zn(2)-C6 fungal-type domain-containing protein n=1 Tax=Aspergillus aculeatus (strain ATCC 16872 / CBS 172.66 / WB 5094) TaxID=690307 RepID=A0A1L9WVG9_ASPA1|nr:uncharacterized protein ASPACDRAFT_28643 [Aspergillus aculeatus ATCC 16872]OJK00180.1 hypothetical protein ASPACDRAFT_28643 [Aspergillus aculeatus ATCC 16872]
MNWESSTSPQLQPESASQSPPDLQQQKSPVLRKSRQSPGSACEECRRRKLRCDRRTPSCGVCTATGVICHFTATRSERGPKRGHLKQLQQRMGMFHRIDSEPVHHSVYKVQSTLDNFKMDKIQFLSPEGIEPLLDSPPTEPQLLMSVTEVPMWMREELDQLYFDRVHVFAPILHQGRYMEWSRQRVKSEAKSALQYTMWTLAASFSGQLQHVASAFYHEARSRVDLQMLGDNVIDEIEIENLQACILLVMHESITSYDERGWLRAGYAFRLVQRMRLYEIDAPSSPRLAACEDWVVVEERRRMFWMAYCLDRFLSMRDGRPLTLIEHLISTRLPAPEAEFQSGQRIDMELLSTAITSGGPRLTSPFAECIMTTTVCGRAVIHHYQTSLENTFTHDSSNFHDRHEWIHNTITQRINILSFNTPKFTENSDPMFLFTRILASTTALYLYHTLSLTSSDLISEDDMSPFPDYGHAALLEAQEMVHLANILNKVNSFKIHPFTHIPLSLCVDICNTYRDRDGAICAKLQEVFHTLRNLTWVNSLGEKLQQVLGGSI